MMYLLQAGVRHIVLAVSYRAEMLEQELKAQEDKVGETIRYIRIYIYNYDISGHNPRMCE